MKQEYFPGNLSGFPQPTPPTDFIVCVVVDALQVIPGNAGIHMVQLMGVHVQKNEC